jgi:hypothetical protein
MLVAPCVRVAKNVTSRFRGPLRFDGVRDALGRVALLPPAAPTAVRDDEAPPRAPTLVLTAAKRPSRA